MKVFKFGGASVKDAAGIINLGKIVSNESGNLAVVVSAFGKTTNALEKVLKTWISGDSTYKSYLEGIYENHNSVINELFTEKAEVSGKINISFSRLREYLQSENSKGYDFEYDQIVSYGEIWSTIIVAEYLKTNQSDLMWVDIREILLTDDRYRDANILWSESAIRIKSIFDFQGKRIYVTQGFLGGTVAGSTTTLGREGSDYTAAILANMLDAEIVVIFDTPLVVTIAKVVNRRSFP